MAKSKKCDMRVLHVHVSVFFLKSPQNGRDMCDIRDMFRYMLQDN